MQVRWKNIPFADFSLEDSRQKIVRKGESGGDFEAVVELTTPSAANRPPSATAQKAPGSEFLGEDEYIKPRDPAIQKQALAITGEIKDRAETVRKLLTWVNTNVTPDAPRSTTVSMKPKDAGIEQVAVVFLAVPSGTSPGTILDARLNAISGRFETTSSSRKARRMSPAGKR